DRGEPAGLVAEAVEERVDDEIAISLAEPDRGAPCLEAAQVLGVRGHDALRLPGRARGEQDVREVAGLDLGDPPARVRLRHRRAFAEERRPGGAARQLVARLAS